MNSIISFFFNPASNFWSIRCLNLPISLARSNDKGSISENHLGTVGGLPAVDLTCAVIPLENRNSYVSPPRTNMSPLFSFSRNPSSILPIIWFPIFFWYCKAEENDLEIRYGEKYLNYKKRTGMFFPKRRRK